MYNNTAEEVASYFRVTPRVVTQWAKEGYPIRYCGKTEKKKLEGAQQVGIRLWRFNLKAVINFIENLGDEKWVLLNENIKRKTVNYVRPKIGVASSTSTISDSAKQCLELAHSQRKKQKSSAMN